MSFSSCLQISFLQQSASSAVHNGSGGLTIWGYKTPFCHKVLDWWFLLRALRSVVVMFVCKVTVGLLALLVVCSVRAEEAETSADLSVGELLERANRDIVRGPDEPKVIGDIAVDDENSERNADPCTSQGCKWPKSTNGLVYVPYVIANHFTSRELQVIQRGLDSFSSVSCIRFTQRSNQRDYISIEARSGCYSYVGRRGNAQTVSLARNGCIYHKTVQHELLHALGFNHEQTRSDRDNHIRVAWENIVDTMKHNFNKIATLNQGTPYDYNSVMQYHKTAFSKNGKPTMIPIPNANVAFGQATQMSQNDITRLKKLYKC
uniref:Metalloendopeptidase n=1 Tax=Astyanax mexicanus TaxID=7994 RepID=A0A8B9K2K1_ASTMX